MRLVDFTCSFTVAASSILGNVAVPVKLSIDSVDSSIILRILETILNEPRPAAVPAAADPAPAGAAGWIFVPVFTGDGTGPAAAGTADLLGLPDGVKVRK